MAPAGVGKLGTAIIRRCKGRAAAEEAVIDVLATPDDELTRTVFANQVKKCETLSPRSLLNLRNCWPVFGDGGAVWGERTKGMNRRITIGGRGSRIIPLSGK